MKPKRSDRILSASANSESARPGSAHTFETLGAAKPAILCSVLACLLICGCAVLTVDVDVYKGPLANHLDVQVQQAATAALAAKPLLGKLRYELERLSRYQYQLLSDVENNDVALRRLYNQSDYIPQYDESAKSIATEFNAELNDDPSKRRYPSQEEDDRRAWVQDQFSFQSPQAAFVNRILAEYNDAEENDMLQERNAERGITRHRPAAKVSGQGEDYKKRIYAARGRPGSGLETLIDGYFRAKSGQLDRFSKANRDKIPIPAYVPQEGELFDALIHFSEKILFNANNSVLFGDQPGLPGVIKARITQFVQGGSDPIAVSNSYLTVLQAVGNSILINLNELREHMQYEQDASTALVRERRALNVALAQDPYRVLSGLLQAIQLELAAKIKELPPKAEGSDPLAQAIADLAGTTKAVDDAQKALKTAKEAETEAQNGVTSAQGKENDAKALASLLGDKDAFSKVNSNPLKAPFTTGSDLQKNLLAGTKDKSYADDPKYQIAQRALGDPNVTSVFSAAKSLDDVKRQLGASDSAPHQAVVKAYASFGEKQKLVQQAQLSLNAAEGAVPIENVAILKRRVELLRGLNALNYSAPTALLSDLEPDGTPSPDVVLDRLSLQLRADKKMADAASQKPDNNAANGGGANAADGANGAGGKQKPAAAANSDAGVTPISGSVQVTAGPAYAAAQAGVSPSVAPEPAQDNPIPKPTPQPAAKPTMPSADDFDAALRLVKARAALPPPVKLPVTTTQPDSPQDVIDSLIAELNDQYIIEVQQNGPNSVGAKNYEAALNVAYGRRADMVYLRPASAYLRSSFPVSSLQRDARIGWNNMLEQHGLHQIPGVPELFTDYQQARILQELDKQNWQNINTVRVAGAGNTNYVVAKDDIGNWYVKNYSADPKDIIQSAQSLALFGLGPGLKGGTDLLSTLANQRASATLTKNGLTSSAAGALTTSSNAAAPKAQPSTVVGREMQDAQSAFDDATANTLKSLTADAMSSAIATKWQGDTKFSASDISALQGALSQTINSLQADIAKINPPVIAGSAPPATPDTSTATDKILSILRAEQKFAGTLTTAIGSIAPPPPPPGGATPPFPASPASPVSPASPGPAGAAAPAAVPTPSAAAPPASTGVTPDNLKKAQQDATDAVRQKILDIISQQSQTIKNYQSAIDLITKAVAG